MVLLPAAVVWPTSQPSQPYWWLTYVTAVDDDGVVSGEDFCVSWGQLAALVPHPGDVDPWYCEYARHIMFMSHPHHCVWKVTT